MNELVTKTPIFDKDSVRKGWLAALGAEPSTVQETVAGSAYTLSQEDNGKLLVFTSNTAVTVTVPDDVTGDFVVPCRTLLLQAGTGSVTLQATTPTIHTSAGLSTRTVNSIIGLEKLGTDEWLTYGDLIDSGSFDDGEW